MLLSEIHYRDEDEEEEEGRGGGTKMLHMCVFSSRFSQ